MSCSWVSLASFRMGYYYTLLTQARWRQNKHFCCVAQLKHKPFYVVSVPRLLSMQSMHCTAGEWEAWPLLQMQGASQEQQQPRAQCSESLWKTCSTPSPWMFFIRYRLIWILNAFPLPRFVEKNLKSRVHFLTFWSYVNKSSEPIKHIISTALCKSAAVNCCLKFFFCALTKRI